MNLRDALIQQSPSLALQRAAADKIAELEHDMLTFVRKTHAKIERLHDLEDYLEAQGLTKDFEVWLAMNTEL